MRIDSSAMLEIVGQLHGSVVDDTAWNKVVARICAMLDIPFVLVGAISPDGTGVDFRFGYPIVRDAIALLEGPLADPARNPWIPLATRHPLRRVATIDDIGGQAFLERSRIWRELYVPFNLGDSIGAPLERQPEYADVLMAGRRKDQPAFGSADIRALEAFLPHIARAWRVKRTLAEMASLTAALTSALDRLERAIVVTGSDGKVRFANQAADRLLSRGDAIDATNGRLRGVRPADTTALRSLIGRATETGVGAGSVAVDAVALRSDDESAPLAVVAEPLAPAHGERLGHSSAPGAILFIGDSEASRCPPADRLRIVYGLTPAEARLTSLIVQGEGIGTAAETLGVSPNTVKYHLKAVFGKVGVSRQTQLVRRVLADVGGLAEPEKMRPTA